MFYAELNMALSSIYLSLHNHSCTCSSRVKTRLKSVSSVVEVLSSYDSSSKIISELSSVFSAYMHGPSITPLLSSS